MKPVLTLFVSLAISTTAQKPAAPGQMVDIGGGRRLHVLCKGSSDGPTVIFEAGLSQYTATSTYGKAQNLISPFARVCVYDRAGLGWSDDVKFARHLVETIGVAVVPGSSFYADPAEGARQVRFAFCKKDATLDEAERRLAKLKPQ